jgi:hypothetical protein
LVAVRFPGAPPNRTIQAGAGGRLCRIVLGMATTHPPTDHPAAPPAAVAIPCDRPRRREDAARWLPQALVLALLVLLTGWAFEIRYAGLDRRDGDLTTDESRLALAAEGIVQTGVPYLPSGRIYTRGLVTAYAMAPSIAVFGPHDWAARLPSVIAGTLLVPATFLLTRSVAGSVPALAAALFVTVAELLVSWSREAWPPATFLLFFTLTTYAAYRGFVRDEPRWQRWAALGFLATLLAYELALILPLGLGLYLAGRALRRDFGWWQRSATLDALVIGVVALGILAALGLALRVGSLAGAGSEFRHYFTPDLSPNGVSYYVRAVWGFALPLLLLVGIGVGWCRLRHRPLPSGLGLLLAMLVAAMLVPTYVIQGKQEVHYGLAVVPLLGILGAWGIGTLAGGPEAGRRGIVVAVVLALVSFGPVLWPDVARALRPARPSTAPTWVDTLRAQGWQPTDLVLAEAPLVSQFYLGRSDFYLQPEGYERYARRDGSQERFLYTDALLLRRRGDFERLIASRYPGRTLWVIGQDDRLPRLTRQMDANLWQWLQDTSGVSRPTRGWWIMRVELPR